MIGYALLIWLAARACGLRDDQAGDNLYYMGFLFTLTSLGVSAYQFNCRPRRRGHRPELRHRDRLHDHRHRAPGDFHQMRQDPVDGIERDDAAGTWPTRRAGSDASARQHRRGIQLYPVAAPSRRPADSFDPSWRRKSTRSPTGSWPAAPDVASQSARPLEAASRRSADTIRVMRPT